MNKICTDIEQSKKLIELGIDVNTSDMFWDTAEPLERIVPTVGPISAYYDMEDWAIPAWSLSALIELMPERIKIGEELSFCLASKKSSTGFSFGYNLNGSTFVKDNSLDAAFEMVCWLKENGKI